MKTTIDIPDDILEESMKFTGAKTKRDAVVSAMETYNRRARAEAFLKRIQDGPPLDFPSNDEIEAADVAEADRAFKNFHSNPETTEK
ncbi:MAG: type II toxin-antitoxin system VapB family antitoxin [Verrucomicrobiaceae bacterium]